MPETVNIVIDQLGGCCPVQAEGTVNGSPFYFRARGMGWTFSVGEDPVEVCCGYSEGFHYEEEYGDGPYAAGWMSEDEARAFIAKAAAMFVSAPLSPAEPTGGKSP